MRWPDNAAITRTVSILPLFATLILGCATEPNPKAMQSCLPPGPEKWSPLAKAPPQAAGLTAQMSKESWYKQSLLDHPGGKSRWFSAAGGTLLAYCYMPRFPPQCGDDDFIVTAAFAWQDGSWQQTAHESEVSVCQY